MLNHKPKLKHMKTKLIRRNSLILALALALLTPALARAGGNTGQIIAKYKSPKDAQELERLKPGDTVVKVCRACNQVTFVRVMKRGKGVYDYVAKKREDCGSEDTFLAVADIPFQRTGETLRVREGSANQSHFATQ